jgi:hypothetical protein
VKEVDKAFYELAPDLIDIGVDEQGKREYAERRVVFIDANVFAKIFDDMEEVAGPVIRGQIKNFGKSAGSKMARKVDQKFKEVSTSGTLGLAWKSGFDVFNVKAIGNTDTQSQFKKILGYGRYAGWLGEAEVLEYRECEKIKVEAMNTFESYSYGRTGGKECNFLKGVFEGLMEYFWDREDIEAEEVECSCESFESDKCVFQVSLDGS